MGTCRDEMTPKTEKAKGLFGKILSKKKSAPDTSAKAQTFADSVADADEKLGELIVTKKAELASEKGREDYNRRALALLESMSFHLDRVIEAGAEYSELR